MSRLIDLTGKTFGFLTVLSRDPSRSGTYWVCRCKCGKITTVNGKNLKRGHTTSCGCKRGTGIVGRRYGKLVVKEQIDKNNYLVLCDCGNTEIRTYKSLNQNATGNQMCRSCGQQLRSKAASATFDNGTQPSKIKLDKPPSKVNKSGITGVNWDKSRNKWQASIRFKGHKYNLGRFANIQDAIDARKKAEKEIFGAYIESKKNKPAED